MRILFLGNSWLGWQIIDWLRAGGNEIVGLVLHPPRRRKYGAEILKSANLGESCIFDGSELQQESVREAIRQLRPDIGLSVLFGYILRQEFLDLLPHGCVNVHPAFLPFNRGAYPNVWSIIEGTPAGVSIHYIDLGVDTGDIIAQSRVPIEPIDTGESLYHKLEQAAVELFKVTWPLIRTGQAPRISQHDQQGTVHHLCDVGQIDEIDLARTYTGKELIDLIRARTFSSYPSAYFRDGNRRIYVRLRLGYEDEPAKEA
ncbi:MAG: formyltransferase family protein [Acidobacteriia bacterium]|nr:formyltransferase family protein [Terriglobia bacterium]